MNGSAGKISWAIASACWSILLTTVPHCVVLSSGAGLYVLKISVQTSCWPVCIAVTVYEREHGCNACPDFIFTVHGTFSCFI